MTDTNVLISIFLFPNAQMKRLINEITIENTLVLSSCILDELKAVVHRKFSHKADELDYFLSQISYEFCYVPEKYPKNLFKIRDAKDYPVMYSAVYSKVDLFITGDKDFLDIDIEKTEILTPQQFLNKY